MAYVRGHVPVQPVRRSSISTSQAPSELAEFANCRNARTDRYSGMYLACVHACVLACVRARWRACVCGVAGIQRVKQEVCGGERARLVVVAVHGTVSVDSETVLQRCVQRFVWGNVCRRACRHASRDVCQDVCMDTCTVMCTGNILVMATYQLWQHISYGNISVMATY